MLKGRGPVDSLHVNQGRLEVVLREIFPEFNLIKNARKEVKIVSPSTGAYLEVDAWYPDLNLGFEFQDDYHYQNTGYSHIPLESVQESDKTKKTLVSQRGFTLIPVPRWWNGTIQSLQATINFYRPELFDDRNAETMISTNPLLGSEAENLVMLASFPMSVELSDIAQNSWWLGEKYDGVRCFWDPTEKRMYSRNGVHIDFERAVNNTFGDAVLDGEIWCGRAHFLEAQILAQSTVAKINWGLFRVICFDEASRENAFEKRYSLILGNFPAEHPTIIPATRFLCASQQSLTECLQSILDCGGEGVILQKPQSPYYFGRSNLLFKIKASKEDQEALVTSVQGDGSLILQRPDGTTFVVRKEDCLLHRRVAQSDVVTYSHDFSLRRSINEEPFAHAHGTSEEQELSHGAQELPRDEQELQHDAQELPRDAQELMRGDKGVLPSNPVVYRIREDLTWEDVLRNSSIPIRKFANEPYQKLETVAKKARGHWAGDRGRNMRLTLETLAKARGLDPFVAGNWYKVSRGDFIDHKEFKPILHHFGSLANAVTCLFPEITFDSSKFATPPNFWRNMTNRRNLFEKIAKDKGRNPLDPEFWYSVNSADISKMKGANAVIDYYTGYEDAVVHLFPEIHFDRSKFRRKHSVEIWQKIQTSESRKEFFDIFAATRGFDPLIPENWYKVSSHDLRKYEGYKGIVQFYGGKLHECLMQLYPHIGLEKSKFNFASKWQNSDNRKTLLHYAEIHSFDPQVG